MMLVESMPIRLKMLEQGGTILGQDAGQQFGAPFNTYPKPFFVLTRTSCCHFCQLCGFLMVTCVVPHL